MSVDNEQDCTIYTVVVNHEEQYRIWLPDVKSPLGWCAASREVVKDFGARVKNCFVP